MVFLSNLFFLRLTCLLSLTLGVVEGKYVRANSEFIKKSEFITMNETEAYQNKNESTFAFINNSFAPTNGSNTRSMASGKLIYYGGPVLSNVKVILVLWGGATNVRYSTQLQRFYAAVTSSSWFNIMSELKTPTQSIGSGSLNYTYNDTSAPTGRLTQDTIELRLNTLISTGKVPSPDANTYYAIHFAPGTAANDQCLTSGGGTICGWHTMMYSSSNKAVYYAVMPDQVGCGYCDSGNGLSDIFSLSSHELAEAVTDPGVGDGWLDSNGEENADLCQNLANAVGTTVGRDGQTYAVQLLWSNAAGKCISGVSSSVPAPVSAPVKAPVPAPVPAIVPTPTSDNGWLLAHNVSNRFYMNSIYPKSYSIVPLKDNITIFLPKTLSSGSKTKVSCHVWQDLCTPEMEYHYR